MLFTKATCKSSSPDKVTMLDVMYILLVSLLCVTAEPQLELILKSKNRFIGKFTENGEGIIFHTQSDGKMTISSTQGSNIISVGEVFYTGYNQMEASSLVEINGWSFLRQKGSYDSINDYYLYPHEAKIIKNALLNNIPGNIQMVMQSMYDNDPALHRDAIENSIYSLIESQYFPLISKAVHYMGEHMKLTGKEYPSLLPLYLMTMKLEEIDEDKTSSYMYALFERRRRRFSLRCLKTCPPCRRNNCLGMCGRRCKCWRWVCGNCCYHYGCFIHDLDCKHCGYVSFKCIFGVRKAFRYCNSKKRPRYRRKRC